MVPTDDSDPAADDSPPVRVTPRPGSRQVQAFARLAAVVGRVPSTEVPASEPEVPDPGILVHTRPAEVDRSRSRLRQEALDAHAAASADHEAALAESRRLWRAVHEADDRVARLVAEEAEALREFEELRDRRRNAERVLRQARAQGEAANHRCTLTSRVLDAARIRAERL
jgi:hypothetical protein